MKAGLSLQALATEIERRSNNKKDVVTKTRNLKMTHRVGPDGGRLNMNIAQKFVTGVNVIGHQQIASHAEIPKPYYDRMLTSNPDLLCSNVNAWFGGSDEPRMVRMLDGNVRALMSDKYRPLENEDLAEAVLPALLDLDLAVMSSQITDRKLYIKAVNRKVERELQAKGAHFGDGKHMIIRCLSPAITISNSEVGLGSLSIQTGVYDDFCSNLGTFGERSMRKYHVGGKHELGGEETWKLLSDDTRRKSDAALWAQVGDIVRGAFQRATFDALCDKIAETTEHKIDGDPVQTVELARKRYGMTEGEGKSVLRHLIEGADLSRFGLYNAITRTAQDLDDYDRASEFERNGANVIELAPAEWKQLAAAA